MLGLDREVTIKTKVFSTRYPEYRINDIGGFDLPANMLLLN